MLKTAVAAAGASALPALRPRRASADAPSPGIRWFCTTQAAPWQPMTAQIAADGGGDVMVKADAPQQTIEGFGACFNELGWTSLALLAPADRDAVLRELFAPGVGAGFTLCRMPVGANDFSRDWYSYDETDGDFALERFSIANDLEALVPFIKAPWCTSPRCGCGPRRGAHPPG